MLDYRRILAVIDPSPEGEKVARRAHALACLQGATLGVAALVENEPIEESSHAPFLTPRQARAMLARELGRRLEHLLQRIGAATAEPLVAVNGLSRLLSEWAPDLVLVGCHAAFGMEQIGLRCDDAQPPFDLLIVHVPRPRTVTGRLLRTFVAAF